MSVSRGLPVFSVVFAVLYVAVIELNWALFTYHPHIDRWGWLVEAPKTGPAMYWYGWLATAAVGGAAASGLAMLVPEDAASRVPSWLSWVIPLATMVFVAYMLRGFFFR